MKGFKYCGMEDTALNRSRREVKEPKMEPWPAKLGRHVQQQPEGPLCNSDAAVGSSSNWEGNSSNNKKFDVFISCRGLDDLCGWFRDVLQNSGLKVFLGNEELQSGERFSEDILEAISCSRVDVCILSSGYAESACCLKELEMMLDKYLIHNSILIPVYYDIKPREVRRLKGAFGQGFQKLVHKGRHSKEVIHKWRAALGKITKIPGFEGNAEGCMILIVNRICWWLDLAVPTFQVPTFHNFASAVGRRELDEALPPFARVVGRREQLSSIIHDIMTYHENGLGVTSVEISGIGGIGKTAFGIQLYNQICLKMQEDLQRDMASIKSAQIFFVRFSTKPAQNFLVRFSRKVTLKK